MGECIKESSGTGISEWSNRGSSKTGSGDLSLSRRSSSDVEGRGINNSSRSMRGENLNRFDSFGLFSLLGVMLL